MNYEKLNKSTSGEKPLLTSTLATGDELASGITSATLNLSVQLDSTP